jgi:protein TonB
MYMPRPTRKLLLAAALATFALTGHAQTTAPDTPAPGTPAPDAAGMAEKPRLRACIPPKYPKDALRAGATGKSSISLLIGVDGSVHDAKVLKSSGTPSLDEAAVAALSKCQFKPATENGKPVEAWLPTQYIWSIQ